jgi:peptidoglycan/LPS O-acetylase OafA/YrhL
VLQNLAFGVPLFYAISAFSLFLGYEHALDSPSGLKKFYVRRFFRIAPLFYAMLLVWYLIRHYHLHVATMGRDIWLNASFAFGLLPGQHEGIVWASWSIGVEWIFYALFPLFLVLARSRWSAAALFGVGVFISAATPKWLESLSTVARSYYYMCFPAHSVFFCAGVLAYRLARPRRDIEAGWLKAAGPAFPWLLLSVSVLWLWNGWSGPLNHPLNRAHLALQWSAVAWVGLLIGGIKGLPWLVNNSVLRYAGRLSFGLYLTNPPVIYFLANKGVFKWFYNSISSPGWAFACCALTSVAAVGLAAQVAYTLVEHPGIQLGERVWKRLQSREAEKPVVEPLRAGEAPLPTAADKTAAERPLSTATH